MKDTPFPQSQDSATGIRPLTVTGSPGDRRLFTRSRLRGWHHPCCTAAEFAVMAGTHVFKCESLRRSPFHDIVSSNRERAVYGVDTVYRPFRSEMGGQPGRPVFADSRKGARGSCSSPHAADLWESALHS